MQSIKNTYKVLGVNKKFILAIFVFFLMQAHQECYAQYIQRALSNNCVGGENVFTLTISGCSTSWSVGGGSYTVLSMDNSHIRVKWNSATTTAYVSANFNSCPSYPYSGSEYYPYFTISSAVTPSVSITANQNNVCLGTNITFTATPTNGGTTPSYAWRINGNIVSTGTSNTFSRSNLVTNDVVSVVMTPSLPCLTTPTATSNNVTMTFIQPSPVSVSITGPTMPMCGGTGGSFMATVTNGGSSPTYTWYKNGVVVTDNTSGVPVNVYAPQNPLAENDKIKCVVTSSLTCKSGDPATSNEITVSVTTPVTPTVSISPSSTNFCAGTNVTFTAVPGSGAYTFTSYSWKLNGATVGTNSSTYSTTQFTSGSVVTVDVAVSGSCLTSYSASGTTSGQSITVKPLPNAGISPSGAVTIRSNESQQINAAPTGVGYSYVWKRNSTTISGATASSYTTNVAGTYTVDVTYNGCSKTSPSLALTVNVKPVANAGTDKAVTLPASSVAITGSATDSDGTIVSYLWTQQSGPAVATLTNQTTTTVTVSNLTVGGSYAFRLTATDNIGESHADDVAVTVSYPPNNHNWIKETVVTVPGKKTDADVNGLTVLQKQVAWNYFDGLGRPSQKISVQNSPAQYDVVQPLKYDNYSREKHKFLPYVTTEANGFYKTNPLGTTTYTGSPHQLYYANGTADKVIDDSAPFSKTVFDQSPLNRVLEQGSPGTVWQPDATNNYTSTDRTVKMAYEVSPANEVLRWTFTPPTTTYPFGLVNAGTASSKVVYALNELTKTRTKDEQYNEVIEYKDNLGRVVLKRVQAVAGTPAIDDTNYASTYYIYDDFDNLVCVIPPEATKRLSTEYFQSGATDATKDAFLKRWAFRYTYDERRRMSMKQVPGADPVYMVYDKRDRVVLTQDGNQRSGSTKYWTFTKYDELNRPVMTGIKDTTAALTQAQMQGAVNTFYGKTWPKLFESYVGSVAGNVHGYTNKSYPVVNKAATIDKDQYLTVNYYDKYDFTSLWIGNYGYVNDTLSQTVNSVTYSLPATNGENRRVMGQVTGTKVKVLDGGVAGGYTWLKSVNYYDDKFRVIQIQADNYKGGIDRISNLYDFAGKVLMTKLTHVERDVTWKDIVGARQDGNKLIRTLTGSSWNSSGAASVQQLPVSTAGWIEFDASETNLARMVGLSDQNTNANYTTIDFAWYLMNTGALGIYESGTNRGSFGTYAPGDVFKIERTGTTIKYYQNNVLKYTSTVSSSSLLMVDVSIHGAAGTAVNVRTSFSQSSRRITRRFVYDHASRVKEIWHQTFAQPEVRIAFNEHNELGQLVDKKLHSTTALGANAKQSVDYLYNIRGWLYKINNSDVSTVASGDAVRDHFGMELGYNGSIGTGNTGLFNGNISGMKWSVNQGYSTMKEMGYNYTYDPMNRLLTATHRQNSGSWVAGQYDESGFSYDLNGNIMALQRKGVGGVQIDNLVYNYGSGTTASNKLLYVQDNTANATDKAKGFVDGNTGTATDYSYDTNGNMTRDLNKGIGNNITDATNLITYNLLNLPETVTKGGNSVRYIYDAGGRKLSQVLTTGTIQKQTDYAGEFIYENDALQFINQEEGRVVTATTKLVLTDAGESTTTMTAVNTTLAAYTNNGEKYISVTSSGTTARSGVFPIGGSVTVQPGERYRIRVKGYRTGTSAVYLSIKANSTDLNWPGATLPPNSTTESWIEQTVTIPAGATTLQAGVTWNTVTAGEVFYVNEFEITQLTTVTSEYQYHLKDHLGNVRVTFTSKDETESATATYETANMNAEQAKFLRYQNARRIQSSLFDRTNGASTGYAQRLNGSANEKYGLARSISVMPGDKLNIEVYAKYLDTNTANWTSALTTLMTQIANGTAPAGTVVDGSGYTTSTSSFPFAGLVNTTGSTGGPKAYLNYILFDRNFVFKTGGYKRLSATPKETGNDVAHERLFFDNLTITEPGYIYIFLSNEETSPVEVFFDDFSVTHEKSPIVEAQDFYPFGLTFNNYTRENAVPNRWKFQEQEHADELSLNWDSFKWRNHQPDIGRFFNVDPLADKYVYNSPYAFCENQVTTFYELEGLEKGGRGGSGRNNTPRPRYPRYGGNPQTIRQAAEEAARIANRPPGFATLPRRGGSLSITTRYTFDRGRGNSSSASNSYGRDSGAGSSSNPDNTHGFGNKAGNNMKLALEIADMAKRIVDAAGDVKVVESFTEFAGARFSLGSDIIVDDWNTTAQLSQLQEAYSNAVFAAAMEGMSQEEWEALDDKTRNLKLMSAYAQAGKSPLEVARDKVKQGEEGEKTEDYPPVIKQGGQH